jgi:tetratricopeptide (TPR) repeat protein
MPGSDLLILVIPLLIALGAVGLLQTWLARRSRQQRPTEPAADTTPATGTTQIRAIVPNTDTDAANQRRAATLSLTTTRLLQQAASVRETMRAVANDEPRIRLFFVFPLLLVAIGIVLTRVMSPPAIDDFTVLVVPFQERGSGPTQTGRLAAERLVAILPTATSGQVHAMLLDQQPADSADVQRILAERNADVLIWGEITPGAMLDEASLTPQIAYRPTGVFAPYAWTGYTGRFALPLIYQMSNAPINGLVVVPRVLIALASYGTNQPDTAFTILNQLQQEYPAINPVLPQQLIGNILWAYGDYANAAQAYQNAIIAAQGGSALDLAMLYNNQAAILQDAGDLAARDALNKAIDQLNSVNADLPELRYNLARAAQATSSSSDHLKAMIAASAIAKPSAAQLLDLAMAMRMEGRLRDADDESNGEDDEARSVLARVEAQIARDLDLMPNDLRELASARLHARYQYEQALLELAILIDQRGPLLWGLQARDDFNASAIDRVRRDLDSATNTELGRVRGWSARAAAQDAADRVVAGRIAAHQARLAERDLRESQRWEAAVLIEVGQSERQNPPQGLAGLWAGIAIESGPLGEANRSLEELVVVQPRDVDLLILLGHDLLARGEIEPAIARFNAADALEPSRPEPLYGLALARLANQQISEAQRRSEARPFLERAIERSPTYYPARIVLAAFAEADGDWPMAVEQRRSLAAEQPSTTNILALARTLRLANNANPTNTEGYAEAERLLVPLVNRNNVQAMIELSEIYGQVQNPSAQRDILQRAQRLSGRNVDVAYDLGILALADNDRAEAERQFGIALAANRAHIPSLLAMAQIYAGNPKAAEYYRSALDAGANDVATLRMIGTEMYAAGEYQLALVAYERASVIADQDAEAQLGRARANFKLNRYDLATQAAQRVLELRGANDPQALLILGDIAFAQGQIDPARERYSAAILGDPGLVAAHIGLGRTYGAQNEWAVASGHFANAAALNPRSADALLWWGEALLRQNDPTSARERFQTVIDLQPENAQALFGLAQAEVGLQRMAEADQYLQQALKIQPDYAEAHLLHGKIYEQQGNERKALEAYEAAIADNNQLPEPHYRRALLLIQANRLDAARGDLDTALQAQPDFPEAHYWSGRIDFAKGQYREALIRFQQAIDQAKGTYPEARFYQGLAEEQLGLREQAIVSFRAALEPLDTSAATTIQPWVGEARAALARLGAQ